MNDSVEVSLILVDPNPRLCAEWRRHFPDDDRVTIVDGYFEDLSKFDCMVSAANSFGLMDGGVDAAIVRFFGDDLMARVQKILDLFLGEQPVGTSMIIETGHPRHPYIAHTPTMRVPMSIARTDHVYNPMWAMLLAIREHNRSGATATIDKVACPRLGTYTGKVTEEEAARQMSLARQHFRQPPSTLDWNLAAVRQARVRWGGSV